MSAEVIAIEQLISMAAENGTQGIRTGAIVAAAYYVRNMRQDVNKALRVLQGGEMRDGLVDEVNDHADRLDEHDDRITRLKRALQRGGDSDGR
jgi:hypothetical protein